MLSHFTTTTALALFLAVTLAAAEPGGGLTEDRLVAIAPKSATCIGVTQFPKECKTAKQALGPIKQSFIEYDITDPSEVAAVISTMAFESGDFRYNIHHFPGEVPGQGTRNMQSAKYNQEYAKSIAALARYLPAARAVGDNAVLKLLTTYTNYDFGSAAWFLTTQCQDARKAFQRGGDAGWKAYLKCIGTEDTSDRKAYYDRAIEVFGGKGT